MFKNFKNMSELDKQNVVMLDNIIATDENLEITQEKVEVKVDNIMKKKKNNFDKCFEQLLDHIQEEDITFSNIINIITKSVEITEKFTSASGLEKKNLTIRMVKKAITEFEKNLENRKALLDFVDTIGPSMIDTIIYVSKGKLAVNLKKTWKIIKQITSKMKTCCS